MFKDEERINIGRRSYRKEPPEEPARERFSKDSPRPRNRHRGDDIVVGPTPAPVDAEAPLGLGERLAPSEAAPAPAPMSSPRPFSNWRSLPLDLLIQNMNEIRECLPPMKLSELNLEEEMLLQYHTIRNLQSDILTDDTVPVNQRAQVANSVAGTLNKLVEMQIAVYSSERFKAIENLLIRTLSRLPEDVSAQFLGEYEKILEAKSDISV